jgi:hypothetical protein
MVYNDGVFYSQEVYTILLYVSNVAVEVEFNSVQFIHYLIFLKALNDQCRSIFLFIFFFMNGTIIHMVQTALLFRASWM